MTAPSLSHPRRIRFAARTGLFAWLVAAAPLARPADLVHVRGPDYTGASHETRIDLAWATGQPAGKPTVLWRQKLGEGYSGAIAAGNRVFTQLQTLAGQFVVCLDLETGRERWRTRTNWPWQPESAWPGPYSTPTYADGRVYFADCFGHVGCLDATTGRVEWSVDLRRSFEADLPGFGYAPTPLVESGKVYLPAGGDGRAVIALNATDGSLAWRAGDGVASYSSCFPLTVGDRRLVVTYLERGPLLLDAGSGAVVWQEIWPKATDHHGTWPLYAESFLFYAVPFREGARVHRVTAAEGRVQVERAWSSRVMSLDILSGAVADGHVYAFDLRDFESSMDAPTRGALKCVELATGRERWRAKTGHCSVLIAGRHLVLLNEAGELILAEASPLAFRELARATIFTGRMCWSPLTIAEGVLLARGGDELVAIALNRVEAVPANDETVAASGFAAWNLSAAGWLRRYYSPAWFAPTWHEQSAWFLACVFGVLMPAGGAMLLLRRRHWAAWAGWWIGAVALAASGTVLLTAFWNKLLLTWPAAVFLGLVGVIGCRAWATENPSASRAWVARLALVAFAVGLLGYWQVCRSLFLVAGAGYAVGLLPAVPLTALAVAAAQRSGALNWAKAGALGLTAFTAFFWSAAVFVWWKTQA